MAISVSTTTQAVDALLKWNNSQSNSQNPQLLPEDNFMYLILTLKKIPQKGGINGARTNPHKIPLPHPLISPTSFPELCLIIDDRPNSKLTSEIAKKKIKSEEIPVTKVIKLSKLKTDYKPFEAKRKLCDSYEMFFADKRVIPLLPKLLGKQFFKKNKLPLPVDLGHKNWKEQIERGCSSGLLFLRTGTCCVIRVAKVSMGRDEIIENVGSAINGVIEFVPKKLSGVRSLHLKFSESVALPLYQCLPDIKLRIEGVKVMEKEVMEIDGGEGEGEVIESAEPVSADSVSHGLVGRKRKGELNADKPAKKSGKEKKEGEEIEKGDLGSAELVGRKRKGVLNGAKEGKKNAKVKMVSDKKSADSGKKKRKGNVVEGDDLNTILIDKEAKKKVEKQSGDIGKKENKKGRSVARV